MIRILHMTPPEVSNGVYRYIFNHMPYIDQSKYEFSFLTKSADSLKKTREYEDFRFPVYQLDTVQRDGREAFARKSGMSLIGDSMRSTCIQVHGGDS